MISFKGTKPVQRLEVNIDDDAGLPSTKGVEVVLSLEDLDDTEMGIETKLLLSKGQAIGLAKLIFERIGDTYV